GGLRPVVGLLRSKRVARSMPPERLDPLRKAAGSAATAPGLSAQPKGGTMTTDQTNAPIYTAEGRYGVFLVELTPDGYRIRHGRYSGYGRGIWHSRSRACRAADHLADGEI